MYQINTKHPYQMTTNIPTLFIPNPSKKIYPNWNLCMKIYHLATLV
jgi:hypothetical protein